jgi:hypothetical protein
MRPNWQKAGTMQIKANAELNLFIRDQTTGRLLFNSRAVEALGLHPAERAQRGYALGWEVHGPSHRTLGPF